MNHARQDSSRQLNLYVLSSFFAALTAVGAFVKVPFPYVPMTLQTLFVLLSGSLLGPRFGALSQIIYLAVGLVGIPIFANGGGPAYILQPTFGYLLAYPVAAHVVGLLIWGGSRPMTKPNWRQVFWASLVGVAIIFLCGVGVLYLNLNHVVSRPTSFSEAIAIGALGFIPGTIVKVAIVAAVTPRLVDAISLRRAQV